MQDSGSRTLHLHVVEPGNLLVILVELTQRRRVGGPSCCSRSSTTGLLHAVSFDHARPP